MMNPNPDLQHASLSKRALGLVGALIGGAFLLPFVEPANADAVCEPWDCPHTVGPEAGYKKGPHQGGDRDYRDDKSWADTPDKSHDRPAKDGLDDKDRNKSRIRD